MECRLVRWKLPVLGALLALGAMVPLRASVTDTAVLKRIASRVDDRAGVISIEASDPVPYVASQPDPRTFVIEMRDVLAVGFADNVKLDPRVPIAGAWKFYRTLKTLGKTVEFDIYPRGGHVLREPQQQRAQMQRNFEWFTKWVR